MGRYQYKVCKNCLVNKNKSDFYLYGHNKICNLCRWLARLAYYGGRCAYCWGTQFLSRDHRIPRVQGGKDWPSNLVPACRVCNSRKNCKRNRLSLMCERAAA